ncbi:MAG: 30S ribosomal protein S3, partial [Acidobacteriota bacterium]
LRADIDYGFSQAYTTYGVIGIKCWVYKGEILPGGQRKGLKNDPEPRRMPPRDRGDRRDRPDRDRERGPRPMGGPSHDQGSHAGGSHPAGSHAGGVVVQPPPSGEMGSRSAILPPMAQPVQPAWKQEVKQEVKPDAAESKVAEPNTAEPKVAEPNTESGNTPETGKSE